MTSTFYSCSAAFFITLILTVALAWSTPAEAAVSQSTIDHQHEVVTNDYKEALRQHIRLILYVLIDRLEEQVHS